MLSEASLTVSEIRFCLVSFFLALSIHSKIIRFDDGGKARKFFNAVLFLLSSVCKSSGITEF